MVSAPAATDRSHLLSLLAELLDYPRPGIAAAAHECRALVAEPTPDAAALFDAFLADLEEIPAGRLEELYSGAFDLDTLSDFDATCHPYVGHHLFGESYRRSRFMAGLVERYRAEGFDAGTELPDHVVVMLRFLAEEPEPDVAEELVGEALLPALARMTRDGDEAVLEGSSGRQIYLRVLEAVRLVIGGQLWPGIPVCSYDPVGEPALAR